MSHAPPYRFAGSGPDPARRGNDGKKKQWLQQLTARWHPVNENKSVYDNVRKLIFRKSGIVLGEHKKSFIEARVFKRLRALGLGSIDEYFQRVLSDPSGVEMEELVNSIATNHTWFFREPLHFEFLKRLVDEKTAEGQRELNVWCAGCSTGEEPYSAAITILEQAPAYPKANIIASDISTRALELAQFGAYSMDKAREVPENILKKYFQKGQQKAANLVRVKKEVRDLIRFHQINLAQPPFPISVPQDVIFCRNVMIYFTTEIRKRLVKIYKSLLKPGGILILGSSESLVGQDRDLSPVEAAIYRLNDHA